MEKISNNTGQEGSGRRISLMWWVIGGFLLLFFIRDLFLVREIFAAKGTEALTVVGDLGPVNLSDSAAGFGEFFARIANLATLFLFIISPYLAPALLLLFALVDVIRQRRDPLRRRFHLLRRFALPIALLWIASVSCLFSGFLKLCLPFPSVSLIEGLS